MKEGFIQDLVQIVGAEHVTRDEERLAGYFFDGLPSEHPMVSVPHHPSGHESEWCVRGPPCRQPGWFLKFEPMETAD